jgi:hypothetical protein
MGIGQKTFLFFLIWVDGIFMLDMIMLFSYNTLSVLGGEEMGGSRQ